MSDLVKQHSEHGASSAYRWMACPGSVSLCRGIPEKTSPYAVEGTAAHGLAELALKKERDAAFWVGLEIEGITVTEEMAEAVQVYVDHVKNALQAGDDLRLEQRITLERLNPPRPMFGTADCVIYRRATKELFVYDYKHGAGVPVEAIGNKQLRYYALGALLSLDKDEPCEHITAGIIQPRADHADGPVREETFAVGDVLDFAGELLDGVDRTLAPDAALNPGGHCRFCKAAAICPAKRDQAFELAKIEFGEDNVLPDRIDPRAMSIEQVANYLLVADQIEDWLRALRAHVQHELEQGNAVPGWKLVNKRATRVWADQGDVVKWASKMGLHEDELFDKKIKSPAQLEKIVGKKNLPAELVSAVSSGFTLARENDKRPAAQLFAGQEFTAITVNE
jgi:hypothetical protein